jgi:oligosaccharide repeat unit polymerase
MSIISITCLLICLGIAASCLRHGADIFSPARVFGFIWCLAFGLADLKLSGLQHEWSVESWIIVLLGPIAFLAGILIASVMSLDVQQESMENVRRRWREEQIDSRRLFRLILLCFALFVIGYGGILLLGVDVPLFSSRPAIARAQFMAFGIGMFLHNVVLVVFFTVFYHLLVKGDRGRKWVLAAVALISLATYAATFNRFQIIMSLVLSTTLLYYLSRSIRFTRVAVSLSIVVLFFYWISTARSGQLFMHYLYVDSKMKFSPAYAALTEPYMYTVMNLENFARSVPRIEQFTYGYYTFDFLSALTGLKHWLGSYYNLNDTPYLISGYNTYSTFWWFYRDFGTAGLAAISILLGALTGLVYSRMRSHPSVSTVSAYSVCIFIMIFSFFANFVSMLWFVYNVAALYLILRLIRKQPARIEMAR